MRTAIAKRIARSTAVGVAGTALIRTGIAFADVNAAPSEAELWKAQQAALAASRAAQAAEASAQLQSAAAASATAAAQRVGSAAFVQGAIVGAGLVVLVMVLFAIYFPVRVRRASQAAHDRSRRG
jgi:hypothetical protein